MATPVIVGPGAVTAALVGRHLIRSGVVGRGAAEQWIKGGFKAKMDRKEAIAILGLKYVALVRSSRPSSVPLAETGLPSAINSRMLTVKSCWPTIPTEGARLTSQVKSTRRRTYLRRLTGDDDIASHLFILVSNCNSWRWRCIAQSLLKVYSHVPYSTITRHCTRILLATLTWVYFDSSIVGLSFPLSFR